MNILALDVGTSSIKAAILDVAGAEPIGAIVRANYELDHPTAEAAEIPAERLWNAVTTATRQALQKSNVPAESIEGIGMACLTPSLVLVDQADKPLGPIWTHLDRRARSVARQVWREQGQAFLSTCGNRPLPGGITVTSYRKQIEMQPALQKRIRRYLHVNGWLGLHMTGEAGFDPGNASFTGLFNMITDQAWSKHWCDYFEVNPDWLPRVVDGDTTIGTLREEIAAEMGLPAGVPVKLGVADTSSAILAVKMTKNDLMHVVGTTQVVAALVDDPKPSEQLLTRLHGVRGQFLQVAHNPVGGVALDWLHELCFRDQSKEDYYDKIIPGAMFRKTTVQLEPPFLGGDRLQIEAQHAAFVNLTLTSDRMDLLAALLHAMREQHHEALKRLQRGGTFERLFLTGGGADVVRQLMPEYENANVMQFEEGSLKGTTRLFD